MIVRARAPLRIAFSGGGTDLSPYCDIYGGYILNATIDLYAYTMVQAANDAKVRFIAKDAGHTIALDAAPKMKLEDPLGLHRAVYCRIMNEFNDGCGVPCTITTFCDAAPGSGLGSSSSLVVSMIKALSEFLNIPSGEYDIARLAFDIERNDFALQGGRQDQYAAAFGGINFMEFNANEQILVNPLRVKNWILCELEASTVLYFTGVSRASAEIIKHQVDNVKSDNRDSINAMHEMKADTLGMKEALLKGDFDGLVHYMRKTWEAKKRTAKEISNSLIEQIYHTAMDAGARAGRVSGAGGGGYMTFIVDPLHRTDLIAALNDQKGSVMNFHFTKRGAKAWRVE